MWKLLPLVPLFLCFNSCALAQSRDQTANGKEMNGAFTLARAMDLVYGSYDYSRMSSRWTPNQTRNYPDPWPDTIDVWPLMDMPYLEDTTAKHLLITEALPRTTDPTLYTCHLCSPMIGFILFAKNPDGWLVEASDLQFGNYGEFGRPPLLSLQPIGSNRCGITMTTSFGSTGEWEKSVTIIIPTNGKFLKVFGAQTEGSSDYNCSGTLAEEQKNGCVAYDGDIEMSPHSGSEYFELVLSHRVYRSFSKKSPVGTTVTRYLFDGSKYVPVK